MFEGSKNLLQDFKNTVAYDFFTKNNRAFEMRIVNKFLWLLEQNSNGRKITKNKYQELNRIK